MVDISSERTRELGLLARWRYVLRTTNPPEGRVDVVSKWLVLTRAAVLPMTVTAGAIAGLLAVHQDGFNWGWYLLALLGIVLAHAANNLMNDLFDLEVGLDSEEYPRGLYAPHPVLSGMISRKGLAVASIAVNVADLVILVVLTAARGWPVIAFALSGFLLSAAYTAPPLRLKKRGLGEPDVLVVWGPLMVGHLPWQVIAASLPYGLLCTAVLMGKHVDKLPWDAAEDIHTLPVILGEARARRATQWLMAAFYAVVAVDIAVGALPWPAIIAFAALPAAVQAWRALGQPRPAQPPADFPIWPLWFAAFAFLHTRRAGALLVLGLIVAAVADITPF